MDRLDRPRPAHHHALALVRYGVLDRTGAGLHNIWGFTSTTTDAALSLLVLAAWRLSSLLPPSASAPARPSRDSHQRDAGYRGSSISAGPRRDAS